jgi:hypothetical protein
MRLLVAAIRHPVRERAQLHPMLAMANDRLADVIFFAITITCGAKRPMAMDAHTIGNLTNHQVKSGLCTDRILKRSWNSALV